MRGAKKKVFWAQIGSHYIKKSQHKLSQLYYSYMYYLV